MKVWLDYREFDRIFRAPAPHPLYDVPEITTIVYSLATGGERIPPADRAQFQAGVVKQMRGKKLIFRLGG